MAGGVIKIPYVAHEAQSVGNIGAVADYKRAADFMSAGGGDKGLLAFAQGLGALGEVIAKQRAETEDLEMLQDFNALRLASQKEYDDFTQNSKGKNAAGAYEYGARRFGERLSALDDKYGDNRRWLRFREQHVNPFGINLIGAYGDYGAKQHEAYRDSVVKGFLAEGDRVIADPNASPAAKLAAAKNNSGTLIGWLQARGLDAREAVLGAQQNLLTSLAKGATDKFGALMANDPGKAGELLAGAMGRGAEGEGGGGTWAAASEALAKDDEPGLYAALFSPGELAEMGKKAEVAATTKKADAVYLELLDAPDGLSSDEAVAQAAEAFTSIKDREARDEALKLFKRDCAAVSLRRDAADQAAKTKFIGLAASNAWPPSEQLKQVDALEGMTAAGKARLRKELGEGTANKPTPENRAALSDLRALIDGGEVADDSEIEAFAFEHGLTAAQIEKARTYLEKGGQAGELSQTTINGVWKNLGTGKTAPKDLFDLVLGELKPGEKPNREAVKKIIANLYMDGESRGSGWFWDGDETYLAAKKAGRAASWLPDVAPEEEAMIRGKLRRAFGPQAEITLQEVREYKRKKMGLSPWIDPNPPNPPQTEEERRRQMIRLAK